jgi:hypothetical protein
MGPRCVDPTCHRGDASCRNSHPRHLLRPLTPVSTAAQRRARAQITPQCAQKSPELQVLDQRDATPCCVSNRRTWWRLNAIIVGPKRNQIGVPQSISVSPAPRNATPVTDMKVAKKAPSAIDPTTKCAANHRALVVGGLASIHRFGAVIAGWGRRDGGLGSARACVWFAGGDVARSTGVRRVSWPVRAWLRLVVARFLIDGRLGVQASCGIARSRVSAVRNWSAHGHRVGSRSVCWPLRLTSRPGSAMSRVRIVRATVS